MTMKQTKKQFIGISYDELLSENARLREELEAVGMAAYSYGRGDLKTENAKLRELVKEAHLCMVNEGCCEDCYATHGECPIERDMRELGVEVDDVLRTE